MVSHTCGRRLSSTEFRVSTISAEYQQRFNETKMAAKRDEDALAGSRQASADAPDASADASAKDEARDFNSTGNELNETTSSNNIRVYSGDLETRCMRVCACAYVRVRA